MSRSALSWVEHPGHLIQDLLPRYAPSMTDTVAPAPPRRPSPEVRELKPPEWFNDRISLWVRRMGLGAWTIRPSFKPKLRGAEGYAKVTPSFLEAELEFRQDILVERGDVVIVHELTHILTDEWATAMQGVIRDMVPKKLQREARELLRPHEESVVDAIAHALVRTAEEMAKNHGQA